jgi:HK97 gp10 family phage protein
MSLKIEVSGLKESINYLISKKNNALIARKEGISQATFYLQNKIKESIARGVNAPVTVDTGRFLNSVDAKTSDDDGVVYTDLEYAKYLEYGTTKMKSRPHFRNTAMVENSNVKEIISDKIKNI